MNELINLSLKQAENVVPKMKADSFKQSAIAFCAVRGAQEETPLEKVAGQIIAVTAADKPSEEAVISVFDMFDSFINMLGSQGGEAGQQIGTAVVEKTVANVVGYISEFSFNWARDYANTRDEYRTQRRKMMNQRDELFKTINSEVKEKNEYIGTQMVLQERIDAIRSAADEYIKTMLEARSTLEDIHDKVKKAKKWCWVPFYNIALCIDGKDAVSRYNVVKKQLENAEEQKNKLLKELQQAKLCFESKSMEQSYLELMLVMNNQTLKQYNIGIDLNTAKILMCSDIAYFLGSVYQILKYTENDAESVRSVISDIKEMLLSLRETRDRITAIVKAKELELENASPVRLVGPLGEPMHSHFAEIASVSDKRKISGIRIRCGYIVDAIQLLYEDGKDGTVFGNASGGGVAEIKFDSGDSLKEITGCSHVGYWDEYVLSGVSICTKNGKEFGPYGYYTKSGREFKLTVPDGTVFRGIFGSACADNVKGNVSDIGLVVEKPAGM